MVSVNRRIAAFLAFYFDTIFALNELLHPGEMRMAAFAKERAQILTEDVEKILLNSLSIRHVNKIIAGILFD